MAQLTTLTLTLSLFPFMSVSKLGPQGINKGGREVKVRAGLSTGKGKGETARQIQIWTTTMNRSTEELT